MANYELGSLVWRVTGNTKDFDKSLATSESKLTKFGNKAQALGKKFSTFLTLPILGAGVAATKAASDLGESINAINVVFGDAVGTIDDFGKTASESVGLSQNAFNGLATVIGAQLKQSGLEIDDVADRTVELTKRSADLASVFNVDVTEATTALGAALRGESEPARRFGINISDAAVQAEALASGLVNSKKEITDQIKVQARYNLILKQSSDVQGDFSNTSDSLANSTRIAKAELENVAAQLGQELIPIATDMVTAARDLIGNFSDLDDGTKKLIISVGGFTAVLGPALITIGKLITVLPALKAGLVALGSASAGPIGLAIAGVGLLAGAVVGLSAKKNRDSLDELAESIDGVSDATELSDEKLETLGETISREISKGNTDMLGFQDRIKELSEELGVSEDKVLDVAVASGQLVGKYKDQAIQLKAIRDRWTGIEESLGRGERAAQAQADKWAAIEQSVIESREAVEDYSDAQEVAALKEQSRLEGVIEARKTATDNFNKEIDLIERKAELELLTQEEVIEAKLSAEEKFQDQLLEIGFDGLENAQGKLDIGDRQLLDSIDRRKGYYDDLETDAVDTSNVISDNALNNLGMIDEASSNVASNLSDDSDKIEVNWKDAFSQISDSALGFFTSLNSLSQQQTENELARIEQERVAKIAAFEQETENKLLSDAEQFLSTKDRLEKEAEALKEFNELKNTEEGKAVLAEIERQEELEAEKERINEEARQKEVEAKREQAKKDRELALFQVAVNTANAVINALTVQPLVPLGLALSGAAAAAGIAQAAAINAAPLPAFQDGGFVQPVPGVQNTGDRIPARLNPGEVVLTQDDARELLSAIRGGNLGGKIVINNTLNTDSQKGMERAARMLYPYMQREGARRG